MNPYYAITTFYGKLYNRKHVPYWFFTPLRRICRMFANTIIPKYFANNQIKETKKRELLSNKKIIVSLTSFPARLNDLWIVINCMIHQTCPPDKIILWLSKEEVKSIDDVPESLRQLQGDLFEIRFVEDSLRSHMKYFYALQEYVGNDDMVITIDDDNIYPPYTIERLLKGAEAHPASIISNTVMKTVRGTDGNLVPYKQWPDVLKPDISKDNFFLGVGGVLYPQKALNSEVFNSPAFMEICKMADDVWLNAMARLNNTDVYHTDSKDILMEIENENTPRLRYQNVGQDFNDLQIKNVRKHCVDTMGIDPFN